jgi:hypothetical protein
VHFFACKVHVIVYLHKIYAIVLLFLDMQVYKWKAYFLVVSLLKKQSHFFWFDYMLSLEAQSDQSRTSNHSTTPKFSDAVQRSMLISAGQWLRALFPRYSSQYRRRQVHHGDIHTPDLQTPCRSSIPATGAGPSPKPDLVSNLACV